MRLTIGPTVGPQARRGVTMPPMSLALPLRNDAFQFLQLVELSPAGICSRAVASALARKIGVRRHPSRGIEADLMPGPLRHNERDAPPMCGRPAGVSRPVRQDHVTPALAGLRIGLVAMVAD